jgi:hypothetical protein
VLKPLLRKKPKGKTRFAGGLRRIKRRHATEVIQVIKRINAMMDKWIKEEKKIARIRRVRRHIQLKAA